LIFFTDKDFSKLTKEFYIKAKGLNLPEKDLNEIFPKLNKKNEFNNNEVKESNDKKDNSPKKENMEQDINMNIEKKYQDENENEVFLSQYNTYIVSGENFEELEKNVEKVRKKKFIKNKHQIEQNNDVCDY
jgi:inorganic pyrophosphatase/exopolyphosphatase